MWYRIAALAKTASTADPAEAFLASALLEQACSDRAALADPAEVRAALAPLRRSVQAAADSLISGSRPPSDVGAAAVAARVDWSHDVGGISLDLATARRKYWPAIPECLGVNAVDLREVVCLCREAAEALGPPLPPAAVVGVRSSGSVLAPILAAHLRVRGVRARSLTVRPGDGSVIRAASVVSLEIAADPMRGCHVALVVDDPPTSGRTLDAVETGVRTATGLPVVRCLIGRRDEGLRRFQALLEERDFAGGRLERRKPPSELARTAVRAGDRVIVPYGEEALARLELGPLAQVAPELEAGVDGPFATVRWLGAAPSSPAWWHTADRARSLGQYLGWLRRAYEVDGVPPGLWLTVIGRRLRSGDAVGLHEHAASWAGRLVRVSHSTEWWHYRALPTGRVVTVPGWAGHWSSVVDAPELVAAAISELRLPPALWGLVIHGYRTAADEDIDQASLAWGLRLAAAEASANASRSGPGWYRQDRREIARWALRTALHVLSADRPGPLAHDR